MTPIDAQGKADELAELWSEADEAAVVAELGKYPPMHAMMIVACFANALPELELETLLVELQQAA